ncbi:TonB-dependent receptor domain-containing protein [Caulobacter hibisci]|uniref:TonB-dependent receptor n=1 Tax=Caulobacter hibisci TaxID=2035993 RepID=A0ABS0T026_9CAUL|nr:TonB-dependent receptor [Caulobacter hibisci]MBI1685149.1 TonB-dependent receptor [Caulobacter hibisci]
MHSLRGLYRTTALAAAIAISLGANTALAQTRSYAFDIPAEPLSQALRDYGRATQQQLLFTEDLTAGKTASAVKGDLSAEAALQRLLAGTGLVSVRTERGAILLQRAPTAAPQSVAAAANAEAEALSEIVVTSQKRAENVQDVPLAISVVSGAQLERASVREFGDLVKVTPSLGIRQSDQPSAASISIRGIGSFAFTLAAEPSVAVQIDEVPVAFQARAFTDLADIERVEVLRGPQSTLYGKNASAGLINIVTRDPTAELTGRAAVTVTSDEEYRLGLTLSGPLSDTLRFRLNGSYSDFDGNVKNVVNGDTLNGSTNTTLRGKLVWRPTDKVSANLTLNYAKTDADPAFTYLRLSPNARLRGNATQTPAVVMPGITPGPDNLQTALNETPYARSEAFGQSLRVAWELPSEHSLVSVTSNDHFVTGDKLDSDRTASTLISNTGVGKSRANMLTQEVRLLSPSGGPVTYTVGLYYGSSTIKRAYKRGPVFSLADWKAAAGSQQMAAFGQLDWRVLPRTTATLGARAQREDIDYWFADLRAAAAWSGGAKDDVVTYRLGLKHEFTDDLMAFGSVSTGHKGQVYDLSTGFNQARADAGPVAPEKSLSFEAGLRSQLLDRRLTLNATVFHVDYDNLQSQGGRGRRRAAGPDQGRQVRGRGRRAGAGRHRPGRRRARPLAAAGLAVPRSAHHRPGRRRPGADRREHALPRRHGGPPGRRREDPPVHALVRRPDRDGGWRCDAPPDERGAALDADLPSPSDARG